MRTVICYDKSHGFGSFEVNEGFSMSQVEQLAREHFGVDFDQFIVLKNGAASPEIAAQWRREPNGVKFLDELNAMEPVKLGLGDGPCAIVGHS